MALSHFLAPVIALVLLVAVAPATSMATEFIVGDEAGWTIGFDYEAWATGKDFRVGDTLVFKYPIGAHNVYKVNATDFQSCTPPLSTTPLTSGNDKVFLATAGKKWYLCGVGEHCDQGGQKLSITVKPQAAAASPSPNQSLDSNYSNNVKKIGGLGIIAVAFVAAMVTIFMF